MRPLTTAWPPSLFSDWGYVHLRFGSNPALAANFIEACRR
jgi:hypothetical protein